jgi:hypothetical protein
MYKHRFMYQFSTVLFVDGNPVGYKVSREQDRVVLNPAENPNRDILPPAISARWQGDQWLVDGTTDRDLIAQVIEDVTLNEGKIPQNSLSAAP